MHTEGCFHRIHLKFYYTLAFLTLFGVRGCLSLFSLLFRLFVLLLFKLSSSVY